MPRVQAVQHLQKATLPTLPALISRQRVAVASDFSEYMCGQDWMHEEALAPLSIEKRMRLFSTLAPTYLSIVQATGRMQL
jgi:hypothetical protein